MALGPRIAVVLLLFALGGCASDAPDETALPRTMLWAWERPEDLRFVDPAEVGVAFLAATVVLDGDEVRVSPRMQPLWTTEATALVAVVRIEARGPGMGPDQLEASADAVIASVDGASEIRAIQLDFDSTLSQRAFHRDLLERLGQRLPDYTQLWMTALASWCLDDAWLDGLPVDGAVPMYFDMGADSDRVAMHLREGGDVSSEICRNDAGWASYESRYARPDGRREWWFHDRAWSEEDLTRLQEVGR